MNNEPRTPAGGGVTNGPAEPRAGWAEIRTVLLSPAVLIAAFIVTFVAVLWLIQVKNHRLKHDELVTSAEAAAESIRMRLAGNRDYLLLLAKEHEAGTLSATSFQERASRYVADHPELINIARVDATFHIQDVAPLAGNRQILGLRLDLPEPKRVSLLARERREPVYTRPFEAIQGKTSFEIWVPIFNGDRFLGLLAGVYSCQQLAQHLISAHELNAHHISLDDLSGRLLWEMPTTDAVDRNVRHRVAITPEESGVFVRFNGYGRGKFEWSLLLLELLCLALGLGMAWVLWGMKRQVDTRKRTEEALRQERALLRCIIDSASDLIFIKDRDCIYRGCNKASETFVGLPEREQIGKSDFDFFDHERAERIRQDDRQVINEGKPLHAEEWVTYPDGRRVLLDTMKFPYYGADGEILGLVGICRDMTERQRVEEELLKLFIAVEQSPVSIVITDKDGTIEFVNPKFVQLTGYSREEMLGENTRIFKSGETPPAVYRDLWCTLSAGKVWQGEFHNRKKNGELFWEAATISPMKNGAGSITHYIAIKEDVTDRKKLEEQLRQSQKMEAIGTLAGGVAHDFNNILTAIIGFGSLLEMKMDRDDPLRLNVSQILEAADRAANLTRSLLAFSRKQQMVTRVTNLNDIIAGLEKMLRRLIREDIQLTVAPAARPLPVLVDPGQIEQVLINLVTNARDAMPDGGKLAISTTLTRIDDSYRSLHGFGVAGGYALLVVVDTGVGMPEPVRQRIFDPFFSTKEVGKGTGLGLSVCYGIIKQHNGYINCYSEPGEGTTFRIYLPLVHGEAEPVEPETTATLEGGTETILLAEDEPTVRELTTNILREFGYTVIEACDGAEAVARFREQGAGIDLCLFDVIMPHKKGWEALAEIRGIRPAIKALFMSGYQPDFDRLQDMTQSDAGFIAKPVVPRELLQKIREMLDS